MIYSWHWGEIDPWTFSYTNLSLRDVWWPPQYSINMTTTYKKAGIMYMPGNMTKREIWSPFKVDIEGYVDSRWYLNFDRNEKRHWPTWLLLDDQQPNPSFGFTWLGITLPAYITWEEGWTSPYCRRCFGWGRCRRRLPMHAFWPGTTRRQSWCKRRWKSLQERNCRSVTGSSKVGRGTPRQLQEGKMEINTIINYLNPCIKDGLNIQNHSR